MTKLFERSEGIDAFQAGRPRVAPYSPPSGSMPGSPASKEWAERMESWYQGWDGANLRANSGVHLDGIDFWDCPCRECWLMEQNLNDSLGIDDERVSYPEWFAARYQPEGAPHG